MAKTPTRSNDQTLSALCAALARFLAKEQHPELANVVNDARALAHRIERDCKRRYLYRRVLWRARQRLPERPANQEKLT